MIRYLLICTFLFARLYGSAQQKADSLFEAGDFATAQLEYERLVFERQPPTDRWLLRKAYCQKAQLRYDQALASLQRINLYESPDSLQGRLFYEKALLHHLNGQADLAVGVIQEWRYQDPALSYEGEVIEILALADLNRWPEAEKAFDAWALKHGRAGMANPLADSEHIKWKKTRTAEMLSFLIPGSGQWYAGFPAHGLLSASLTGAAALFAINQFSQGFFFAGAYTGVGLFYVFYWGGARYAVKLAEAKNQRQRQKLMQALYAAFQPAAR